MTTRIDPRLPLILDDDWEPPPHQRRFPLSVVAIVVVIVSVAFVSARGRAWMGEAARVAMDPPDSQESETRPPLAAHQAHDLEYRPDSVPSTPPPSESPPPRISVSQSPRLPVRESRPLPVSETQQPVVFPPQAPDPAPVARSATPNLPSYLAVNSTPWAVLSVDGYVVGHTPQLRITVFPGRHELTFARDGFATLHRWVNVEPGDSVRITDISLTRSAP